MKSVIRWPYAQDFELWVAFNGAFERLQTGPVFMHLSMVCPRMGGSGNPGEIWHFQVLKCQFPHPWVFIVGKIPTPGDHWPSIKYVQRVEFRTLGIAADVKIPTHVRLTKSNSPGLPDPPILGQTIDRCITLAVSWENARNLNSILVSLNEESKSKNPRALEANRAYGINYNEKINKENKHKEHVPKINCIRDRVFAYFRLHWVKTKSDFGITPYHMSKTK